MSLTLVLVLATTPVPKVSSCPLGWYVQGSYCVPAKAARPAVVKVGSCPLGWNATGSAYCVRRP